MTPEYWAIQVNRSVLIQGMVNDVHNVSGELLAAGMITGDNHTEVMNNLLDDNQKVQKLMMFIENRIKFDHQYFTTFVNVLKKLNEPYYRKILQKLQTSVNTPPPETGLSMPQLRISGSVGAERVAPEHISAGLAPDYSSRQAHSSCNGNDTQLQQPRTKPEGVHVGIHIQQAARQLLNNPWLVMFLIVTVFSVCFFATLGIFLGYYLANTLSALVNIGLVSLITTFASPKLAMYFVQKIAAG